uniref:Uncharacterized protein n=1 Tax=Davidia involucrata TaxID=16924 RepID=A0A5B7BB54_DAVIN
MARLCNRGVLRLVMVLVGLVLVGYVVGPLFFWQLKNGSSAQASCPSCSCNCSSETIFSVPLDCGPDMEEEMRKDITGLLAEELDLLKNVTDNILERTMALTMEAKKSSSHYQKEAEKCNAGMETCEEARERAEAALTEERKITAFWEERAHELGWKDERRVHS